MFDSHLQIVRRHALVCFALVACSLPTAAQTGGFDRAGLLGVSLAGAEFGAEKRTFSNRQPGRNGTDYVFNSADTIAYFGQHGLRLVRLPFRWERIQPKLGQRLDTPHLNELLKFCRAAQEANVFVILDVHNYGRYRCVVDDVTRECVIDQEVRGRVPVSRHHLADLWTRLAKAFRREPAVVGYGLMNEPHDMGSSNWKLISQLSVDAIRRVDRQTAIVVAGDDWSSAERFVAANGGGAWIRDPVEKIVYEAHCYFDRDGSGKYRESFASELQHDPDLRNRGVARLKPFADWCRANNVRGLVGEFGVPADPQWKETTRRFLRYCERNRIAACYWAGGEWWGDYPLSIQPADADSTSAKQAAPQLKWLLESR